MELIRGLHNLVPRHRGSVVSIGNFDGLHLGHQALIERLNSLAVKHGVPATVVIFEPTPREYFSPDKAPPRIASFRGKLRGLEAAGVARVLCLRFDAKLAMLSGTEFIEQILIRGLGARAVVVGDDFRFGKGREGDLALLRSVGATASFTAEGLGSVVVDGIRCSSTALRQALAQPNLAQAQKLLNHGFRMVGRVRHGLQIGRTLGMPTANIHLRTAHALAHGVYAVRVRWPGKPQGALGVASVGVRPTLGMTVPVFETYVFDFSGSLYGIELEVELSHYLRPQLRFDSMEALAAQMHRDAADARAYFERHQALNPVTIAATT